MLKTFKVYINTEYTVQANNEAEAKERAIREFEKVQLDIEVVEQE